MVGTGSFDVAQAAWSCRQVVFSLRSRIVRSRSTVVASQPSRQRVQSSIGLPFWKTKPPPSKSSPSLPPTMFT